MKKIFTFFIAMVVTLSMYAVIPNTLGEKIDPTGRATELASKQQAHRQQMAKALRSTWFKPKALAICWR